MVLMEVSLFWKIEVGNVFIKIRESIEGSRRYGCFSILLWGMFFLYYYF